MGVLQFACLVGVLAVCALAGWMSDYRILLRLGALAVLAPLAFLPAFRTPGKSRTPPYMIALVVVGFATLSRVGAANGPSLGPVGFVVLYALALGAYGAFFVSLLRRTAQEEKIDEEFVRLDLWIFNVGLVCFAGFWLVEVMRGGFGVAPVLKGLAKGLVPLGMSVLFLLTVRTARDSARERTLAVLVVFALVLAVALGAGRLWGIHRALHSARQDLQAGRIDDALEKARKALADNAILKWSGVQERAGTIRRDVYGARREYRLALKEMAGYLLRRPRGEMTDPAWKWFRSYLDADVLEPAFHEFNRPEKIEILNLVHDRLSRDPKENGVLQLLFVQSGRLDRLAEWYAWQGMPDVSDLDAWELALKRLADAGGPLATQARFFLGAALLGAGRYEEAMRSFETVLETRKDDANAIVLMERIASIQGRLDLLTQLRKRPRRIVHGAMQGNHEWGLNVGSVLWTALEVNPGRYEIALKARGKPAQGIWPQISVYVEEGNHEADGPGLVLRKTVDSSEWTVLRFEWKSEADTCRRLMLVFDNDYYSATGGERENRDLQFEVAEILYHPR